MFGFRGVYNRKPRQFDYRPRYFDPEQERRENRKKELLGADYESRYGEKSDAPYVPGQYIKRDMLYRRGLAQKGKAHVANVSPVRFIVILGVLLAALIWVLNTESLQDFFGRWLTR